MGYVFKCIIFNLALNVFNFAFANHTILSCFFLFFLIIDLYFFDFCSYYTHTFNPTTELVIPAGLPTNEANAEIETQPLTSEMKMLDVI